MKSQQLNNKQIKKSKKHLHVKSNSNLISINNVAKLADLKDLEHNEHANCTDIFSYPNGFDSDNRIEILVNQNQNEFNSYIKTERKKSADKIFEKFHTFYQQNFKLKITMLMIPFILFVMICCSLVFVHLLKQELNIVKLKVDKIENSYNDPAVIKVNNVPFFI